MVKRHTAIIGFGSRVRMRSGMTHEWPNSDRVGDVGRVISLRHGDTGDFASVHWHGINSATWVKVAHLEMHEP